MNSNHDDVNGIIVGGYMLTGQLTYQGKNQGQVFYAETEDELNNLAIAKLQDIKAECGRAFQDIYPTQTPGWRLKIID